MTSAPTSTAQPQRRGISNRTRNALWGYLLIAPALVFVLAFTAIPVVSGFAVSLTNWDMLGPMRSVGLSNYANLISDPLAQRTLLNTFVYTFVSVPISIALSLLLAVLLNQSLRGISFFRTLYYVPVVSSTVAVAVIFTWVLDPNFGLLNQVLGWFGVQPIPWLTSTRWAMPSVILVTIWRGLGYNMIILLAALQDVPQELHDAAAIDGASPWRKFISIIVPLVTPAIFFVTITGIISSFQSFDLVYNMTEGGPGRATFLIGYFIWQQAFDFLRIGYASAMAFILFFLILIVTIVQWQTRRAWVFGEE